MIKTSNGLFGNLNFCDLLFKKTWIIQNTSGKAAWNVLTKNLLNNTNITRIKSSNIGHF